MLWATRYAVNVDLSILPHLSRHPKLIGRSIVCSTVRVSRTRRGLTSPRWRRTRMTTFRGRGGGLLGREVRARRTFVTRAKWTDEGIRTIKDSPQAPSSLRRPDHRNEREGERRLSHGSMTSWS